MANVLGNSCFLHILQTQRYINIHLDLDFVHMIIPIFALLLALVWSPPALEKNVWLFNCYVFDLNSCLLPVGEIGETELYSQTNNKLKERFSWFLKSWQWKVPMIFLIQLQLFVCALIMLNVQSQFAHFHGQPPH